MAEPGTASSGRAVSLTLGLSADRRYLGLLRDLTKRLAERAGAESRDARRLGDAVDRAVGWILPHAAETAAGSTIEIEYAATRDEVSACVRCDVGPGARRRLESDTSRLDPVAASLAEGDRMPTLRGLVDRVDVGRQGSAAFCRFTCQLPSPAR